MWQAVAYPVTSRIGTVARGRHAAGARCGLETAHEAQGGGGAVVRRVERLVAVAVRPAGGDGVEPGRLRALLRLVRARRVAGVSPLLAWRDAGRCIRSGVRRHARLRDALAGRGSPPVRRHPHEGQVAGSRPGVHEPHDGDRDDGWRISGRLLRAPRGPGLRVALSSYADTAEHRPAAAARLPASRRSR